ncbi:TPA: hypothetical protein HHT09_RS28140 [Escherichia coli]|jgi:hypothetical protein|uniref:Uncharacterized protein n=1 Tax=Edwardsiella piscicida TaxID=1263550 RepID=A0AAU8PDU1_EDWPI|nr:MULTISPECIES: hypothetical protein [Gammaproteobacteria]ACY86413.1 hypothetical protein ETAE_p030 [Edwardsiella tarda EIB202]|mmetsp:Transcript_65229/g.180248  ORF Transcript_65229/g.180248 Transcript_65229/m.180248 type:complete len:127 (+) Transcript_65229:576-956(+)
MSKQTLIDTLAREFQGETFTHFAVMTWASGAELATWKEAFRELVEAGALVAVEERPLGTVYKMAEKLVITASAYNAAPSDYRSVWTTERFDLANWSEVRDQYMGKRTLMDRSGLHIEGLTMVILDD